MVIGQERRGRRWRNESFNDLSRPGACVLKRQQGRVMQHESVEWRRLAMERDIADGSSCSTGISPMETVGLRAYAETVGQPRESVAHMNKEKIACVELKESEKRCNNLVVSLKASGKTAVTSESFLTIHKNWIARHDKLTCVSMTLPVDHVAVFSYCSSVVPSRGVPTVDICSTTRSQPQRIVSATLLVGRIVFFFKFTASVMKLIYRTAVKIWAQQITPGARKQARSGSSWNMAKFIAKLQ